MSASPHLHRREVLAALGGVTFAVNAQGCASVRWVARLIPISVVYELGRAVLSDLTKEAVKAGVKKVAEKVRTIEFRKVGSAPSPGSINESEIRGIAREHGADEKLAVQAARIIGPDRANELIKKGTRLWCQENRTGAPINSVIVQVRNRTKHDIGGQLQFGVFNKSSGQEEHSFWRDGFSVSPGLVYDDMINWEDRFATTGLKIVKLMSAPEGVGAEPIEVFVLPVRAIG